MRRIVFSTLCAVWLAGEAAAKEASWIGEFTIHEAVGVCPDFDPTGTQATVRFRPQVGTDDDGSRISIFYEAAALNLELPKGNFDKQFRQVNTTYVFEFAGPVSNPVAVKFTSVEPKIDTGEPTLQIEGQISGYNFMPECIVKFRMALVKRGN